VLLAVVTRRKLLHQIPRPTASQDLVDTPKLANFVRYVNGNVLLKKHPGRESASPFWTGADDAFRGVDEMRASPRIASDRDLRLPFRTGMAKDKISNRHQ
jgi:hypothetical protein